MNIIDPIRNKIGLGSTRNTDTIGIVIKTAEELGGTKLGLYIPKFMLGYSMSNGDVAKDSNIKISKNKCINDDSFGEFWKKEVTIKNYITVYPYLNQNQSMPQYVIGDKVIVQMIDNDLKTLAFLPYSINRLGQRATDKCMFSVPANPEENTAITEDNVYFFKLDSTKKVIILSTSDKNGEQSPQTISIDGENGQIVITDNKERLWIMDTKEDSIITQTSGSTITQKAGDITLEGDNITLKATDKTIIESDVLEVKVNTLESKAKKASIEYNKLDHKSDSAKYNIQQEEHSGLKFKHHHTNDLKNILTSLGAAASTYPMSPQGTTAYAASMFPVL